VLLPMTRRLVPFPTYIGPPGAPPPPSAAPTAPRPLVPRPAVAQALIPQRLAREPATPPIRARADRMAEALERPRSAALGAAPP